jgi:hypothetical protein
VSDLWDEASGEHEHFAREAALTAAGAELDEVMPFLLAARSAAEYDHREALAQDSFTAIAARTGVSPEELAATARRRYELMVHALMEGVDVLEQLEHETSGFGSGPEKPDEHSTGPDFSGDYAEVPLGPSQGPDPKVVAPRPPMTGPVQEATGSLRRQADGSAMMLGYTPPLPPDTGVGAGSVDMGLPSSLTGGMDPSLPAGVSNGTSTPLPVTASKDPVRREVLRATAAIKASNPQLADAECERVARQVVGRFYRQADLAGSVTSDEPVESGQGGGGGQGGGHSGMSGLEEYGLGRALISAAPEILAAL